MLRRIGFRYNQRVDPFDGGPHFMATTDEIELVQRTRQAEVQAGDAERGAKHTRTALVARSLSEAPYFRAVPARVSVVPGDPIVVAPVAMAHLGLSDGDRAAVLPLY